MASPTQPSRYYSYLPNGPHNVAGNYIWDVTALITGVGQPTTGAWRPAVPGDFSSTLFLTGTGISVAVDDIAMTGGYITDGSMKVAVTGAPVVTITGVVQVSDSQFTTVTNSTVSGSMNTMTTGQALPLNAARNQFYAQVLGSGGPLYLVYGTSAAGTGNCNVVLKAASAWPGSDGGILVDDAYNGAVTISGGIGCMFTIWQA